MAETLKPNEFDWTEQSVITTSDKAVYPWDDGPDGEGWFNGDAWMIEESTTDDGDGDFSSPALMMERIIRTRATGRRAKVRVRHPAPTNGKHRFTVTIRADTKEAAEKLLAKKVGKDIDYKYSPFGTIVLQRTDIEGPTEAKARERKEKAAATRAAKNGAPAKKTVAKKTPAKKVAASKRPARKLQAVL